MPLQVSSEENLANARAALLQGEHARCLSYLVGPLETALGASNPEVLVLLDQLVQRAENPLALFPKENASAGMAAACAYILGKLCKQQQAYAILRQLVQSAPGGSHIDWALSWLDRLSPAQKSEAIALFLYSSALRFTGSVVKDPIQLAALQSWLPYVLEFSTDKPKVRLQYFRLLRQSGRTEEALKLIRAEHANAPSKATATILAATLRTKGDYKEWYAVSMEVLRLAPNDLDTHLDLGDCFWHEQGNLSEAARWYGEILKSAPDHDWALPSYLALQYLITKDPNFAATLQTYACQHMRNRQAQFALDQIADLFIASQAYSLPTQILRFVVQPRPAGLAADRWSDGVFGAFLANELTMAKQALLVPSDKYATMPSEATALQRSYVEERVRLIQAISDHLADR